jgi:hypothetical protein
MCGRRDSNSQPLGGSQIRCHYATPALTKCTIYKIIPRLYHNVKIYFATNQEFHVSIAYIDRASPEE